MDIQALIEAAKAEGGEQAFAHLAQEGLQKAVQEATTKLQAEIATLKTSVTNLEAKREELLDEVKPLQNVLRDKGLAWKTTDDLAALGAKLEGTGEPSDDAMKIARQLAGPMAEEAMAPLKVQVVDLQAQLEHRDEAVKTAVSAADRSRAKMMLRQAQMGKDGKREFQLLAEDYFLDEFIMPYLHFEDVESGGKKRRISTVRNGDVPIMTAEGQAGLPDLLRMAHERSNVYASNGTDDGRPNPRDFIVSHGSGTGATRNSTPGHQPAVDAKALGATQSLDEYKRQREKAAS